MNRNKLKTYAPKARRDFIKAVTDRAAVYGLMKEKIEPVEVKGDVAIIGGKPFPKDVAEKRRRLEERIEREGFDQVMEAMAYTWFNRFVAIRYMEVHGYLDHGYRVFSTKPVEHPEREPGSTGRADDTNLMPDILKYSEHVDLPGLDREKVVEFKLEGNRDEKLYRMLLIAQCNALNKSMPFLFERIGDATELLLPDNLLHSDSLIRRMVNEIPEEEWQEVEIFGWLYQFYISEKKEQVIGKVVKSEDIPAATQLFTPNWIVKYMVQNTIGRMWLATYPNSPLKQKMEYYIEPAKQEPEVEEQLKVITPESLNPEEMTLADVACGSGHILVEGYDLFKAIYQERGYRAKDIPRLILEKNLYGLEIDDRAAQLAAFALMMKAREDDRRIFDRDVKLNVMAIQNSPKLDDEALEVFLTTNHTPVERPNREPGSTGLADDTDTTDMNENEKSVAIHDLRGLLELFKHGKTFGSLIRVPEELGAKLPVIVERVEDVLANGKMFEQATAEAIFPIVQHARILAGTYDASVTNPPYMGGGFQNARLKTFLKQEYPGYEKDLFSAFIVGSYRLAKYGGHIGFMSPFVWMFISSYKNLRNFLIDNQTITSLVQLEYSGFDGATVPICTFTIQNAHHPRFKGGYVRLSDFRGTEKQGPKTLEALQDPFCTWFYRAAASDFKYIPGSPIAYWFSPKWFGCFANQKLGHHMASEGAVKTGNNERFVRYFWEVNKTNVGKDKNWRKHPKGGAFRKWYGNVEHVVDWSTAARKHYKENSIARIPTEEVWDIKGITWTAVSSSDLSFRIKEMDEVPNNAALFIYPRIPNTLVTYLCCLNSITTGKLLKVLSPTLNFLVGDVLSIPIPKLESDSKEIEHRGLTLLHKARADWVSYETSWDFQTIPLMRNNVAREKLRGTYEAVEKMWQQAILKTQHLEEENNDIFIEAYGLQNELKADVPLSEITLTCNPHYRYGPGKSEEELEALLRTDTMKELVSYAVGCMMGRYSLDAPGLIYAHSGNEDFWEIYKHKVDKHTSNSSLRSSCLCGEFLPDEDGIIPITDIDWFPDDAANRFIQFISVAWPKEHLEENLQFVADSLSPKKSETPRETIRRYMATGFFKHHMKMYKKRPIYWLFTSGKLRAFQCLVYLHRYNEGTLSRMRTEYVIPLQGKFAARIEQLSGDIDAATSTSHRKKLEREKEKLQKQKVELQAFDEKLRHYADQRIGLDLDDGVKMNYGKFGDLLAEVQAVTGKKKK